jgi:predicted ATPase
MRLMTLGGLGLEGAGDGPRKPLLLSVYLAFEGAQERRHLAELFWRDAKDPMACLRVALARLRATREDLVRRDGSLLWTAVRTDAQDLVEELERGSDAWIDAYRGPFLHGVGSHALGVELDEWILRTREYLAGRARLGLLRFAEGAVARGERDVARRLSERAVSLAPLEELEPDQLPRLHAVLVSASSPWADRVAGLAAEYGLEPLQPEARSVRHGRPFGVDGAGPGVASAAGAAFVGRADELRELHALLLNPRCRLLTLHGGGGTGKTRLAQEAARRVADQDRYADGVHLVDLTDLVDPASVPDRIAQALGLVVQARGDEADQVAALLGERHALIVLDNFEHVLAATDAVATLLRRCPNVDVLVTSRARLGLAGEWTLAVGGLGLPDDGAATMRQTRSSDAVRLFELRAQRHDRTFALGEGDMDAVRRICRRLDGSPLGLELAAARVRAVPLRDLADDLERGVDLLEDGGSDLPVRHRGLRAAFEHSWDLLDERDRAALRRLSTFRGGFRREAASAVAGVTLPSLARLVDASMLRLDDDGRYQRHPFLYEFSEGKLDEHPEEKTRVRERHGHHVLGWLRSTFPEMAGGPRARLALDLVHQEEANIAAAWRWGLETGAWQELYEALPSLATYAEFRARFHYVHALADEIIARVTPSDPVRARLCGMAHGARGFSVFRAGDPQRVVDDGARAHELLPPYDPRDEGLVCAHWWASHCGSVGEKVRGEAELSSDHARRALRVAEEALAVDETASARRVHAVMAGVNHHMLALADLQTGDLERAGAHDEASRRSFRAADSHAEMYADHTRGQLLLDRGDPRGAERVLRHGIEVGRWVGNPIETANVLAVLARAALAVGDLEGAKTHADEALGIARDVGDVWLATPTLALQATIAARRGRHEKAGVFRSRAWALAEAYGLHGVAAEAVVGRAHAAAAQGDEEEAARLLRFVSDFEFAPAAARAEARRAFDSLGVPVSSSEARLDEVRRAMAADPASSLGPQRG